MKNKIQHIIAAIALTLGLSYVANAQVTKQKIGNNPTTIAPSAVLDIESANKGVLFPRVALTATSDATTIASPAEGLTIYNTATTGAAPNNVTPGYYYWNGTKWTKVLTDSESSKWTYDATNSRINLTNLANGTTARTGATNFAVTDGNVLQIGDMTNVSSSALPERGIMVRKNGNASITSVSDGGIYSVFENQIYGGNLSGSAAYNVFAKSRGSLASPQAVQNGDLIGIFDYRGFSGTGYGNSARIMTRVEGPVTTTSVPVSFEFHTVGPGETSPSQRLKISSNGNVGIGASSPANKLEITQGTAGNSGLRFTNLTSSSSATTSSSKVLGVNNNGDVILTNVPGTQNIVDFTTATPTTTGVVFTPNTPVDESVIYQSAVDNSMWTYNGTAYVTYNPPASTAWNLAGTTNDAGSNKTAAIERTGSVSVTNGLIRATGNGNVFTVDPTQGPGPRLMLGTTAAPNSYFELGAYNSMNNFDTKARDFNIFSTARANALFLESDNGNIGIGTNTPLTNLHVQSSTAATNTVNADATLLRLSRPTASGKWGNVAQFNLGSYTTGGAALSRLDIALNNAGDLTTLTTAMTLQADGNVGIGTTAPTQRLDVNGTGLFRRGNSSNGFGSNQILFGHNGGSLFQHAIKTRHAGGTVQGNAIDFYVWTNAVTDATVANQHLMSLEGQGRVGIGGITNPTAVIDAASTSVATNTVNASRKMLRLSIPTAAGVKTENVAEFNMGSYEVLGTSARTRLDLSLNNNLDNTVSQVMTWQANGNVGIGTTAPISKLEVDGSSTNKTAFNAAASSTIDFSKSNLAYTTLSPQAFILQNMKDGGTYTLAVQGKTAGTASFTASGFTFKSPNNGPTINSKETIYTFIVMGPSVYVYMTAGINDL